MWACDVLGELMVNTCKGKLSTAIRFAEVAHDSRPEEKLTFADSRHHCTASLALERCKFVTTLLVPVDDKIDPTVAQVAYAVV